MKTAIKIMAWVTLLLLSFILICGLWISANGADAQAAAFHTALGILTVATGAGTCILALVLAGRKKKEQTLLRIKPL